MHNDDKSVKEVRLVADGSVGDVVVLLNRSSRTFVKSYIPSFKKSWQARHCCANTVFLLSKSRRIDVAEGWRGVEVVAIDLLQLYRAWLGVCRAMFAAWSRLTSVS